MHINNQKVVIVNKYARLMFYNNVKMKILLNYIIFLNLLINKIKNGIFQYQIYVVEEIYKNIGMVLKLVKL